MPPGDPILHLIKARDRDLPVLLRTSADNVARHDSLTGPERLTAQAALDVLALYEMTWTLLGRRVQRIRRQLTQQGVLLMVEHQHPDTSPPSPEPPTGGESP